MPLPRTLRRSVYGDEHIRAEWSRLSALLGFTFTSNAFDWFSRRRKMGEAAFEAFSQMLGDTSVLLTGPDEEPGNEGDA